MNYAHLDCETDLERAVAAGADERCPPQLANALHYAVFPGGARVRPQLCMAVAAANTGKDPSLAKSAACAIELLHCASLVHDDLPCFDDATVRRGKPSVHSAFGERIAVLTGDALIVMAFQVLAKGMATARYPDRGPAVMGYVADGVAAPCGIAAGQAWECEQRVDLALYHQSKTGALFIAATCAGAAAAGVDPTPWRNLGASIGEAYQVADDIKDATSDIETIGKPTGIDIALDRPSAVRELGVDGAVQRLRQCMEAGLDAIPQCDGRAQLQQLVRLQSQRFIPKNKGRTAA
ncbi:geranylgeranyl pyrophosphate synthetase [Luminiphilus syltensis NOR5-1B]|uniref:Geranylgeranyl pyrophosphate synthetase n=1 Tax=Luminiphilus syltensis NOR5-1B TaxID=565045 RepID=B8KT19_9GAMM|nr:polyprenyl synthetase family protein [Luminiphilus syltensis]EED35865.1 geranylgeranyl pyrophosphate synthetase [Luminiphilus syltensis NOR5-1B]